MKKLQFDIIIIGGGIAGLWTLALARENNINAILLEKDTLGCGQTIHSQGIIHGGSKYALAGTFSKATNVISEMPSQWQDAINGHGQVKLEAVKVLSDKQYLIPTSGIDTKVLSFLGSKTMRSHTSKTKNNDLAQSYRDAGISQSAFQLNEMVLDIQSVLQSFYKQYHRYIFKSEFSLDNVKNTDNGLSIDIGSQELSSQYVVLACGEGYENIANKHQKMQKRPLHMLMATGKNLPPIYAHFIGRSSKPLLTISSYQYEDETVWYLGGGIAEDGVNINKDEQIDRCKKLLSAYTPNIDLSELSFDSFAINRAEPQQSSLLRPDDAFVTHDKNLLIGWPTKLALAPRFAEKVLEEINGLGGITGCDDNAPAVDLVKPSIANFPWQHMLNYSNPIGNV